MWDVKHISSLQLKSTFTPDKEEEEEEEWIEVEGFKGVYKDMTAHGGFQYEVGKKYIAEGEIQLCMNGFHFCLKPFEVYKHYDPDFNVRYFKVKAIVRKKDFDNYRTHYSVEPKLVAKEITLIEEIPIEKMDGAKERLLLKYPFVKIMNTIPASKEEYQKRAWDICKQELRKSYSDSFMLLMLGEVPSADIFTKMKAYADEGLSPDMRAYLLINEKPVYIPAYRGNLLYSANI